MPLDVSATIVFLFVLFGAMLDKAGAGKYFVDLAFSLLGRFKGGPAKAAVLASGADRDGFRIQYCQLRLQPGTFTIPLMKSVGYPAHKAGAVEVACSTNGQLMPPIMGAAAFIIAEYCNLEYVEVIRAAFIPAVVSYIALMYITHLEASKLGTDGNPPGRTPPVLAHFYCWYAFSHTPVLSYRGTGCIQALSRSGRVPGHYGSGSADCTAEPV